MDAQRQTLSELKAECQRRGLSTASCLERADLERLLWSYQAAATERSPSSSSSCRVPISGAAATGNASAGLVENERLGQVGAELDSWVVYPPRALALLEQLRMVVASAGLLKDTRLGLIVGRYRKHPDARVVVVATELVNGWKKHLFGGEGRAIPSSTAPSSTSKDISRQKKALKFEIPSREHRAGHAIACHEPFDSDASEETPSSVELDESDNKSSGDESVSCKGWSEKPYETTFHRKKRRFRILTLRNPFECSKWMCRIRIAEEYYQPEAKELLDQMACDFGASKNSQDCTAEDKQMLQRLRRLEERFRGNGVTDGEARNAMRLFERELSKANWTEDKFIKLKRQLEGSEDLCTADQAAEGSLLWTAEGQRRQAWFSDACQRIAAPLGLEFGFTENGGCCFAGPLSATAGAVLTSSLVCHLADLDLARAKNQRGASRLSVPQFMQGFVDGALDVKRHLIWEKIFSIEDDTEAARFCQSHVDSGFFDDDAKHEGASCSQGDSDGNELSSLLRGLFNSDGAHRSVSQPEANPRSFTPFTGSGKRMNDEQDVSQESCPGSASWALTFASNLQLVRSSRQRSSAEAQKTYNWGRSARAVKATQTGTESYSKGKQAGEKRKTQIDGTSGSANRKYKSQKLAIAG